MNAWIIGAVRAVLSARFPASWAVPAWTNWLGLIVAAVFSATWANDHGILVWLLEQELVSESSTRTLPRTIRYLSLAGVLLGLIGSFRVLFWPPRRIARLRAVRKTSGVVRDFFSPHLVPLWHGAIAGARTLWRWSTEFGIALAQDFRRFGRISRSGFDRSRAGTTIAFGKLAAAAGAVALVVGAVVGRLWFVASVVSAYIWLWVTTVLAVIGYGLRVVGSVLARGGKWWGDVIRRGVTRGDDAIASGLGRTRIGLATGYAAFIWLLGRLMRLVALLLAGLFAGAATILFVLGFIIWVPIRFIGSVVYVVTGIAGRGLRDVGMQIYSLLLRSADKSTYALGWTLRQVGTGLAIGYRVGAVPVSKAIGALGIAARATAQAISLVAVTAFSGLIAAGLFAGSIAGVAFDYMGRGFLILALLMLVVIGALVTAVTEAFGFLRRGAVASAYLGKLVLTWFVAVVLNAWRYALTQATTAAGYLATGFRASVQLVVTGLRIAWSRIVLMARFAWGIVSSVIGYLHRGLQVTADVVGSGLRFVQSGLVAAIIFVLSTLSLVLEGTRRVGLVAALLLLTMVGLAVLAATGMAFAVWHGLSVSASALAMVVGSIWSGVVYGLRTLWTGIATTSQYAWLGLVGSARAVGVAVALAWSGVVVVLRTLWLGVAITSRYSWLGFVASMNGIGVSVAWVWSGVVAVLGMLWMGIAITSGYAWHGFVAAAIALGVVIALAWTGVSTVLRLLWLGVATASGFAWLGVARSASTIGTGLMFVWTGVMIALAYVAQALAVVLDYLRRAGMVAALIVLTLTGAAVLAVSVLYGYVASGFLIAASGVGAGLAFAWAITASALVYIGSVITLASGYVGRGLATIGRIIRAGFVSTSSVAKFALKQFGSTLSAGYVQSRRSFVAVVGPVARGTSHGGAVMFRQIRIGLIALIGMVGVGASVVFRTLRSMGGEAWFLITGGTGYLRNGAAATGSYASAGTASIGRPLASGGATSVGVVGRVMAPVLGSMGRVIGYLRTGASTSIQLVPRPGLLVPLVVVTAVAGGGYYGWGAIGDDDLDDTLVVAHWTTGHLTRDGLLKEMAEDFNKAGHVTSSGEPFIVRVYDAPSELQGEYLSELLINGVRRDLNAETNGYVVADIPDPTIVTPSSAHWLVSTNYEIGQAGMEPVVDLEAAESIVKPVIGIVTYEVMARCLGWPNRPIGFEEIIALRDDPLGWGGYTCANETLPDEDWGQRPLLAFTDPTTSSTGRSLHLALYAFAAEKSPGELNVADVTDSDVVGYVKDFQSLIDHYLIGTTVLNTKIYQGKEYGHFFVMPEDNLIHLYEGTESSFFNGVKATAPPIKERMVMIYPKEGSMPRNNCACIVQAEWVTPEHVEASRQWIDFIRQIPQQQAFMAAGFRPGIEIDLNFSGSKITGEFGLDPTEPKVVVNPSLTLPEVAAAIDETWDDVKRPGIVTIVADTSGSMLVRGKLGEAKDGMKRAVTAMAPNNRVGLVTFNDNVSTDIDIAPLSVNRDALRSAVQDLHAVGETALYDAIKRGIEMTDGTDGDENAIRAVIVLTDGRANKGDTGLDDLIHMSDPLERLIPEFGGFDGEAPPPGVGGLTSVTGIGLALETEHPIQIFFIGIGSDADLEIGRMLAEATGGEFQKSSEEDLAETLEEFSAYF